MKKKTRIMFLGIVLLLVVAMSGCGVNQKTPESVVESLVKSYVDGKESEKVLYPGNRYQ